MVTNLKGLGDVIKKQAGKKADEGGLSPVAKPKPSDASVFPYTMYEITVFFWPRGRNYPRRSVTISRCTGGFRDAGFDKDYADRLLLFETIEEHEFRELTDMTVYAYNETKVTSTNFSRGRRVPDEAIDNLNRGEYYQYIEPECFSDEVDRWLGQNKGYTNFYATKEDFLTFIRNINNYYRLTNISEYMQRLEKIARTKW